MGLAVTPALANEPVISPRCNEFTFDSSSSHDPDNKAISVFWDFGDGTSSTEPVADHTYAKSGVYQVTLSVSDNAGLECSTAQTTQKVKANIAPVIKWKPVPEKTCVDQAIVMDASESMADGNRPLSFRWNFSDGSPASKEPKLQKIFDRGGTFKISLNVDDQSGTVCSSRNESRTIQVNEPPKAEAGEEEILICLGDSQDMSVLFDASKSSDANQDPLTYRWDFGDGRKGTGVRATNKYRKLGTYDVKLIVQDNSGLACSTGIDFARVTLSEAPKADAGSDVLACPGEAVTFDGTNSYSHIKGTLTGQWTFGDGSTAPGLTATHIYKDPGKYQARLTVENKLNAMCPASHDTRTVTVNARPAVSIKTPAAACVGNVVAFEISATDADDDNLEFYWSFGDGTILRSGPKVSHEYKLGGMYKVSVIVDDGRGTACSTATAHTQIKINTPPVADAGPNLTCCVDAPTAFDGTGSSDLDGDRLDYTWNFSDGSTAQGAVISHSFTKSGSYNVTLTVDDNSGTSCGVATAGFVATASSSPVPVMKIR